jgi:hypothetical protein
MIEEEVKVLTRGCGILDRSVVVRDPSAFRGSAAARDAGGDALVVALGAGGARVPAGAAPALVGLVALLLRDAVGRAGGERDGRGAGGGLWGVVGGDGRVVALALEEL